MRKPDRKKDVFEDFDKIFEEAEKRFARVEEELEREVREAFERGVGGGVHSFRVTTFPDGTVFYEVVDNLPFNVWVDERKRVVVVEVVVPHGVPRENVDVAVTERLVTIKVRGEREYSQDIELPAGVIPESARISWGDSTLEISLKKA